MKSKRMSDHIRDDAKDCVFSIIEINSAPGLDHYAAIGSAQRRSVDALYLKVLRAMRH